MMAEITPLRTIRKNCIDCVGLASLVRECGGDKLLDKPCRFFPYRMGRGRPKLRVIRENCLWCMGDSPKAVKECPSKTCPFLPYRMGRNPKKAGMGGKIWAFRLRKPEKGISTSTAGNREKNHGREVCRPN